MKKIQLFGYECTIELEILMPGFRINTTIIRWTVPYLLSCVGHVFY